MENNKQKMVMYAVPCNIPFVVASEKAEEFNNLKPNPELRKKIEEATSKLNIKIEIEPLGPRKVLKLNNK